MRRAAILFSALSLVACSQEVASPPEAEVSGDAPAAATPQPGAGTEMVAYDLNPEAGRALFIDKGCVICHSVNGVGGKAAPALDAEIGGEPVDPLDFAARMWRGAPAMIELQSVELGYTIYLTADDIAHLAAFAADRDAQRGVTLDSLPETTRNGLLDERFWELENWDEYFRSGQEGGVDAEGAVEPEEPAEPDETE